MGDVILSSVAQQEHVVERGDDAPATLRVKPDLMFPRVMDVTRVPFPKDPYRIVIVAIWREDTLRYEVTQLDIHRNTEFITSAGLRTIAVHEILQELLGAAVRAGVRNLDGAPILDPSDEYGAQMYASMALEERLLWAARIYAIARATGEPPLKTLAARFGVSQSTATRLVSRARELDLVD